MSMTNLANVLSSWSIFLLLHISDTCILRSPIGRDRFSYFSHFRYLYSQARRNPGHRKTRKIVKSMQRWIECRTRASKTKKWVNAMQKRHECGRQTVWSNGNAFWYGVKSYKIVFLMEFVAWSYAKIMKFRERSYKNIGFASFIARLHWKIGKF